MRNKIISIINGAIEDELKDCRKWYRAFLEKEQHQKIKTAWELRDAMDSVEPQDDWENIIFSSGFISGMECAKRCIEANTRKGKV
jgi:hypothetical protein